MNTPRIAAIMISPHTSCIAFWDQQMHPFVAMRRAGTPSQFDWVHLNPNVTISSGDTQLAHDLHNRVGDLCFIARSVNFEIRHTATIQKV